MKIFTTACLVASVLLCFILVWLFGQVEKPGQPRSAKIRDVQQMQATTMLMLTCLIGSGVGSIVVVRRAKVVYRNEASELMKLLAQQAKTDSERSKDE